MRPARLALLVFALTSTSAWAETPGVPADARQLTGAEIGAWLDGKSLSVEIFDAEVPIKATTNWDLAAGRVSGTFNANGKKGRFDNEWVIKDDTSCTEKTAKGAWICQKIFVKDDTMYEVTKKGVLHAISKVK